MIKIILVLTGLTLIFSGTIYAQPNIKITDNENDIIQYFNPTQAQVIHRTNQSLVVYFEQSNKILKYEFENTYPDENSKQIFQLQYTQFLKYLNEFPNIKEQLSQWVTLPEYVSLNPKLRIKNNNDQFIKVSQISVYDGKYFGKNLLNFFKLNLAFNNEENSVKDKIDLYFETLISYLESMSKLFNYIEKTSIRYMDLSTDNVIVIENSKTKNYTFTLIDTESFYLKGDLHYFVYKERYLFPVFAIDVNNYKPDDYEIKQSFESDAQTYKIGKTALHILMNLNDYLNKQISLNNKNNKILMNRVHFANRSFNKIISTNIFNTKKEYNDLISVDLINVYNEAYETLTGKKLPERYRKLLDLILSSLSMKKINRIKAREGFTDYENYKIRTSLKQNRNPSESTILQPMSNCRLKLNNDN